MEVEQEVKSRSKASKNPVEQLVWRTKAQKHKRQRRPIVSKEKKKMVQNKLEATISRKKAAIEAALKCPPVLNMLRKKIDSGLRDRISEALVPLKPETKEEHAQKLQSNPSYKPKESILFGLSSVVKSIERKESKLVLIANNVDPVELVLFLPSLCKKMGIPYAILDTKAHIGSFVRRKAATSLSLTSLPSSLAALIPSINEAFSSQYESDMKTWGNPARERLAE